MKFKFKIKSFFIKTLLIILAASFVLFGIINFFGNVGETNIVQINDQKINAGKFTEYVNNRRSRLFQSKISEKDINFINSKDFVNLALRDFINNSLIDEQIKKLNLMEPKTVVFEDIYKDSNFKNDNNEFDLTIFNNFLSSNQISEVNYLNFLVSYNSRNALNQLVSGRNLDLAFIVDNLLKEMNNYYLVDIIEIKPDDLKFDYQRPTNEEIAKYYNENSNSFLVAEEKIISSIDINLNKYKDNEEELKNKLSELEDLTLSAKNIDEIANLYKVKKNFINYLVGDENSIEKLPSDLNLDILQFGVGTFSNLIYKDNNIYRIYYIEKVNPSKKLSLAEATDKIIFELLAKNKEKNINTSLDKLVKQMRINGIDAIALRNNLKVIKNEKIYRNDINHSDELIEEIISLKRYNTFTKPVFDDDKGIYEIGHLRETKPILENNSKYLSKEDIKHKYNISYRNSLNYLFQDYLINSNTIIINTRLLETLQ